jgi:hypothetical protein
MKEKEKEKLNKITVKGHGESREDNGKGKWEK